MKGLPLFSEEISMVFPQEYIDDNGAQKYGHSGIARPHPRRQPTPTTRTGRLLRCQDFGQ
jgi:hypothetical protein